MNGLNSVDVNYAKAIAFIGLNELGIIDDPFIEEYRKAGNLLSEGGENGMSINGLASLANGEFYDGKIPHQNRACVVALYKLGKNGWKKLPDALGRLAKEGVLTKEIVSEIMKLPEYQERVSQ